MFLGVQPLPKPNRHILLKDAGTGGHASSLTLMETKKLIGIEKKPNKCNTAFLLSSSLAKAHTQFRRLSK